jgi:hypothetical protein
MLRVWYGMLAVGRSARAARDHSLMTNGQVTLQVTVVIMGIFIQVKGIYLLCSLLSNMQVAQDPTTLN